MKYSTPIAYISGLILFVFAIREILTAFFMAPGLSSGMVPIGVLVILHLLSGGLFFATSYRQIFRPRLAMLIFAIVIMVVAAIGDTWALHDVLNSETPDSWKNQTSRIIDNAIKESLNEQKVTIMRSVFGAIISLSILSIPLYSNLSRSRYEKPALQS